MLLVLGVECTAKWLSDILYIYIYIFYTYKEIYVYSFMGSFPL